jgi:hypothetical protein
MKTGCDSPDVASIVQVYGRTGRETLNCLGSFRIVPDYPVIGELMLRNRL